MNGKAGRPPKKVDPDGPKVRISMVVDPALKNLLLKISEGYDVSMTEMVRILVLGEAGLDDI